MLESLPEQRGVFRLPTSTTGADVHRCARQRYTATAHRLLATSTRAPLTLNFRFSTSHQPPPPPPPPAAAPPPAACLQSKCCHFYKSPIHLEELPTQEEHQPTAPE